MNLRKSSHKTYNRKFISIRFIFHKEKFPCGIAMSSAHWRAFPLMHKQQSSGLSLISGMNIMPLEVTLSS
jgi:hypothetical protein